MKKAMVIFTALLQMAVYAQARTNAQKMVPEKVMHGFDERFSGAKVKRWMCSHDTETAMFSVGHRKEEAQFLTNGTWLGTAKKIPWTWDLPRAVNSGWKQSGWAGWNIERIEEVDRPGGKCYRMKIYLDEGPEGSIPDDNYARVTLLFDQNGRLTQTTEPEN